MTDHTAIVQGMAAGVGGAVLALLGVDAQILTAALCACSLGALLAPPTTRPKAVLLFCAAISATAISASVLGPMLAGWWPGLGVAVCSKGAALAVGIWLHPLIQAGAAVVPRIVNAGAAKLPGTKADGGPQQ